jgi:uncharacterized surface protein with fasciclin (FAS1) repeats
MAAADPAFSTLVTALDAADLVTTLSGEGPFTVFAPTDAAFARLPDGTVEELLNDLPALTEILLFHVTDARTPAGDVVTMTSIPTLQGSDALVDLSDSGVTVAGANITVTDIPAANGIIHIINAVMLP